MAAAPSPTATPQPPATNRPPMTLSLTAYIADGAYIRGTHPITIGANTLVHPRAYINSTHSPINIGANCIIYEKATIGGPLLSTSSVEPAVPNPTIHLTRNATSSSSSPPPPTTTTEPDQIPTDPSTSASISISILTSTDPLFPSQPQPITIHNNVLISPHTHIQHSTTVHASVLLEPHVTVLPNSTIGANTKICAGVTIAARSAIPAWTVILSDGSQRRSRRAPLPKALPNSKAEDGTETDSMTTAALGVGDTSPDNDDKAANDNAPPQLYQTESHRLHSQQKERDSTMLILKQNARMSAHSAQIQAKRQSQIAPSASAATSGSGSNRDSVIR